MYIAAVWKEKCNQKWCVKEFCNSYSRYVQLQMVINLAQVGIHSCREDYKKEIMFSNQVTWKPAIDV